MNTKSNKGITLIALVITIIVLLILAGVVISMLSGENGILKQAAKAKEETEIANKQEMANLLLQEIYIIKNSGEVTKEKLEKSKFTVYTIDNKYVVLKDDIGLVLDSKGNVLAQSSDEIAYDIYLVRKDYLAYKEANPDDKTTTLQSPYQNIDQYDTNDSNLLNIINSYKPSEYKMSLQLGNLVCLWEANIMTVEKIAVCEALGIYYLGDGTGDHIVDWWDCSMIYDYIGGRVTNDERLEIVLSTIDVDGAINAIDANFLGIFLRTYITKELLVVDSLVEEYWTTIDEKGIYDNDEYKQINETTVEGIQKYIPSYQENLGLPYKMIIQRGELYWVYDKTKQYAPSYISATNIYILGDVTKDNIVNETDISRLERYIKNSSYRETGDLNNNGTLDEEDLALLKELVN